jgi:Ca2+-binding EF-hand superfamily protein
LSQLIKRRDNIAKSSLVALRESCQSPYINSELTKFIESIDADTDTIVGAKKYDMIHESIDNTIKDGLYQEFSLFGTTKLKRIDPAELDYILIRMENIESESDKMMLISYLHSKLDTIDYYLSILNNPNMAKKYSVPHSKEQLLNMRELLEVYRMKILKYKIPDRKKGLLVQWAPGYEG